MVLSTVTKRTGCCEGGFPGIRGAWLGSGVRPEGGPGHGSVCCRRYPRGSRGLPWVDSLSGPFRANASGCWISKLSAAVGTGVLSQVSSLCALPHTLTPIWVAVCVLLPQNARCRRCCPVRGRADPSSVPSLQTASCMHENQGLAFSPGAGGQRAPRCHWSLCLGRPTP